MGAANDSGDSFMKRGVVAVVMALLLVACGSSGDSGKSAEAFCEQVRASASVIAHTGESKYDANKVKAEWDKLVPRAPSSVRGAVEGLRDAVAESIRLGGALPPNDQDKARNDRATFADYILKQCQISDLSNVDNVPTT